MLIQVSFLLLRFGEWCPPGFMPSVDKALSMLLRGEPNLSQRLDALVFLFFGRLWYPVVGYDHVLGA